MRALPGRLGGTATILRTPPGQRRVPLVTADHAAFARASTDVVAALDEVLRGGSIEVERHAELSAMRPASFARS